MKTWLSKVSRLRSQLTTLHVDNVDELWERLKTRARIVYPIETMAYGVREFGVLNDNDYQLSFAQDVRHGT